MARRISVEILGDSRSLERAFARSSRSASDFNRNLSRTASGISGTFGKITAGLGKIPLVGTFLGAAGIGAGVKFAIDAASDLNEQLNRTNVVFGDSAKVIEEWSKTTANAMGIAQAEALEAAGSFGGMFRVMGIAEPRAADMSKTLVQLAADMASFNNEDPSDMLDRLRSGLVGEAEPLRRFQVLLSEAAVQQEAYRSGIARVGAKLTEQQKVLARYNIILRQTKLQQGDFANTADSWANVQRRVSALLQETAGRIGTLLLPKLAELGNRLANWLANAENQDRVIQAFQDVATVVRDVATAIKEASDAVRAFTGFMDNLEAGIQKQERRRAVPGLRALLDVMEKIPQTSALTPAFRAIDAELKGWEIQFDRTAAAAKRLGIAVNSIPSARLGERPFGAGVQFPDTTTGGLAGGVAGGARGATIRQRNAWFDADIARRLTRLQYTAVKEQLSRLQQIAKLIAARIKVTKDITRRLNLEDQLLSVQAQIQGARSQLIQDAIHAQEEANRKLEELAEKQAVRQFRLLGFGPGGADLIPGVRALQRQLANVRDQLAGSFLDTKKTRSLISHIRTVLSGQLGKVGDEVRQKIQEILADLNRQLKDARGATATQFQKISAQAFLASLGITLTPEELRRFRMKFAALGPGGTLPKSTAQGAGQVAIAGNVYLYGVQDVKAFETELTKRAKQRAHMRRSTR